MNMFQTIGATLSAWTGSVAAALISGLDRIVSPRLVRLVEGDDDGFAVEAAGKAENIPSRIAFSDGTLSAPARAADFLEGIVRAQIDRLTPWSASEAVFGCSAPSASGAESITTMIAATTRKVAMTYVQAVSGFHPAAIAVCTDIAERDAGRVKVFEQKARGHLDAARLSRALLVGLGAVAVAALLSVAVAAYEADNLGAQERTGTADFGAARRHSRRLRRRRSLADRSARAAQIRDAGQRDRARGADPGSARPYLRHRTASGRQQAADIRHHPRRAVADSADRAIASFRPRHLLCADDPRPVRSRRTIGRAHV
jgi:general secretion pathway protein L